MPSAPHVKPTHKAIKTYYAALATYADQSVEHEGALRSAFQNLLSETGRKVGWTLIPELSLDANGHQIRPDGTFRDEFTIERGYWEAKDTDDDLATRTTRENHVATRGDRLPDRVFGVDIMPKPTNDTRWCGKQACIILTCGRRVAAAGRYRRCARR